MRYYSTQSPVMPGSYPKSKTVKAIRNFDTKTFCEEIGREAWGYIDYEEALTKEEAEAYELMQSAEQARQQGADDIDIFMGIVDETIGMRPQLSPLEKIHGKVIETRMEAYHDVTVYEDGYEDRYYIGD